MSPMLSLAGVTAGYGGQPVVNGISFSIAPGEFCALLGLNGSGKTTLLKAVCGLLPMESGHCSVNGQDCTNFNEYRRARLISYMPQRHSKLQGVSVLDAVMMGFNARLGFLEFPAAPDRALALEALIREGLGHLAGEDFSRLSEGQKQMVILIRTLIQNTPAVLMDEPDSALDFLNRRGMFAKIRQMIHSEGKAGLAALHDPNFALAYCDRLILLHKGKIVSDISTSEAGREDIQLGLSKIYGGFTLLEHNGTYVIV